MRLLKKKLLLSLILIITIIIPALILAVIAYRGLDKEDLYIEKSLQLSLLSEVNDRILNVLSVIRGVREELAGEMTPDSVNIKESKIIQYLKETKKDSPLIGIPFYISAEGKVVYPDEQGKLSNDEAIFLKYNRDFLENRITIPVYKNIAVIYQKDILENTNQNNKVVLNDTMKVKEENAAPMALDAEETAEEGGAVERSSGMSLSATTKEKKSAVNEDYNIQSVINEFRKSDEVQDKIYSQADTKGQKTLERNVVTFQNKDEPVTRKQRSLIVVESLKFANAIEGREDGFIPRFVDDDFNLLYYRKLPGNKIAGSLLNVEEIKREILALFPDSTNQVRYLTVLDDRGRPLLPVPEDLDVRLPFVSREVSEVLPRWEVAAYLADPGIITVRANNTRTLIWIIMFVLILSLVSGGGILVKTVFSEVDAARKKTSFVTNVTHELKTPLTAIRMFAEMLREGRVATKARKQNYLDIMISETERLSHLINNVLDFSRMDNRKKEYRWELTDLNGFCEKIYLDQKPSLEHSGFTFTFQPSPDACPAVIDRDAVTQVIVNLLSNAEKYSPDKKEISLACEKKEQWIFIHVRDRGKGIPESLAKKIFDPFFRVDDSLTADVKGTGLGLSIARKIITDHKGSVYCSPCTGGGTCFTIKLRAGEKV
ncbi:MAG: HAMP domain-containing histidine kinase [Spirochaetales bacterium]|nr:HAMP domain-containing histidine kinase [Spirochaetales bacterium]